MLKYNEKVSSLFIYTEDSNCHMTKMHIIEQAKILLDFDKKLDISLLDGVVNLMYSGYGDVVTIVFKNH